jgi:hypothetical protein
MKWKILSISIEIVVIFCIIGQNLVNSTPFVTTINHIQNNDNQQHRYNIEQSAVILVNDLEELQRFNDKIVLSNRFPKQLKFIVVFTKSIDKIELDLPRQLTFNKSVIAEFQYFLVKKTGNVELSTFEWFTKDKCNEPQHIQINSLAKSTLEWKTELQIEDKFMNLHQCSLETLILPTSMICLTKGKMISFDFEVSKLIAQKSNFQVNVSFVTYEENEHGLQKSFSLIFQQDSHIFEESAFCHLTVAYDDFVYGFILPPTEAYTSYEKLLMPFDQLTWIFLITTFGCTFGFIFVLKRAPVRIQELIFGEGIRTPAFNVVEIFFGMGQVRLPVSNFPRIILMTFIFFCLIIRTAYQGVFYEMLTHDLRRPQPETIAELFDQNYTLFMVPNVTEVLKKYKYYRRLDKYVLKAS